MIYITAEPEKEGGHGGRYEKESAKVCIPAVVKARRFIDTSSGGIWPNLVRSFVSGPVVRANLA